MIDDLERREVTIAIRAGRNDWSKAEAILRYQAGRLIGAEGVELAVGTLGLSGTIYVVKDIISRDNRTLMRIERQRLLNGKVVDANNLGEVETLSPSPPATVDIPAATPIAPETNEAVAA